MVKKTVHSRALMSLALGASIAFNAASAGGMGNIIDESTHDYSDSDIATFTSQSSDLERAEFAASERHSYGRPREKDSSGLPWVSETY